MKEYLTPQGFFAGMIVSFGLWAASEIYAIKEVEASRYTEQQVTQIYNDKINDWVESDGKQILVALSRVEANIMHINSNLNEVSGVVRVMSDGGRTSYNKVLDRLERIEQIQSKYK